MQQYQLERISEPGVVIRIQLFETPPTLAPEKGLVWKVYTPPVDAGPTIEQLREQAKYVRAQNVEAIKVTTVAGNMFDGDETSQGRMARAIIALNAQPQDPVPTVNWVLADNSVIQATAAELTEALALAGAAQAAIWVIEV